MNLKPTEVVTGKVRLNFPVLFTPKKPENSSSPDKYYSVQILIPKSDTDTMNRLKAAIEETKNIGLAKKWGGVMPLNIPTPIHDGDGTKPVAGTEYGPECKGHWVFTASSAADKPVEVVDANLNPIISPTQIYSGIYANISVNFFPYNFQGKKGIGCGLGPVQKVADGEPLGGQAPSAKSVFAAQPTAVQKVNPLTGQPM